jgi:hypothetical protein
MVHARSLLLFAALSLCAFVLQSSGAFAGEPKPPKTPPPVKPPPVKPPPAKPDKPAKPAKPAKPEPKAERDYNEGALPLRFGKLPLLWIPKQAEPAKLDGTLNDPVWKEAAQVDFLETTSRRVPTVPTEGYLFCSDSALYMGFRCSEARLGELDLTAANSWERDALELFIEPYKDTLQKPYHHVIIDASGKAEFYRYHVYQRHWHQPRFGEETWKPKVEIATGRTDKAWTLELRIPFDQLVLSEDAKNKKTLWRLNMFRTRPKREKAPPEPHLSFAWSPPGAMRYHEAGKFGYCLPETFSTPEFIEEVKRTAQPAPEAPQPVDDAAIDAQVALLAAEEFDTRQEAIVKLLEMKNAGQSSFDAIEKKVQQTMKDAPAVETYAAAKDVFDNLKNERIKREDDDPPPFGLN